jgi:AraC-like DNA-binding protein/ligand-binding sensor protein
MGGLRTLNILFDCVYISLEIARIRVNFAPMRPYLERVDFQCFAESREFAEFSVLFRNLTGIASGIYDADGRQLKTVFAAADESALCRIIRSTPAGAARCESCNRKYFAEAARTRRACRYTCHAGLVDVAVPIFLDGRHVATISCGQLLPVRPSARGLDRIMRNLRGLPLPRAAFRKAYFRASYLESGKVDAAVKMLTFFAEYLGRMGLTLRAMADRLERPEVVFARRYVEDHFRDRLSVEDVAKKAGLSPSHFSTVFRKATGQTFVEHVQRRRVEEAKSLLAGTPKTVTEICFQCGFTNLTYFNRVFRRWTGASPRQYRANTVPGGHRNRPASRTAAPE